MEPLFAEMKRYVRFEPDDEASLRAFAPVALPQIPRIVDQFYQRVEEHEGARAILSGADRVERLKDQLGGWMAGLFTGPWDDAYFDKRARIGRVHVDIGLPQRYMFGGMAVIRGAWIRVVDAECAAAVRASTSAAIHKLLDLELAVMLESYREAFVDRVQAVRTRRAERLASLGTMAAGLAHEIRNPLNAAHLQLVVAQRRLTRRHPAPDVKGALEAGSVAAREMQRLAGLVEDFLQFARPHPLALARADLRELAKTIVALVAPEASATGVDLAAADGPPVFAQVDGEKLKQVLLNLIRNAIEATGRGGRVRLDVTTAYGEARLMVQDDGPGVSPDAPIFEPFFTTKPQGTGLGLPIAHRIAGDHGGRIDLESRMGRTVFTVVLPIGEVG
jgi:two-component system, NtrC family, sensor histidine kinase HydH